MRYTKKVSMWPVGLITKYGVSSPIVRNGTISGFYDGWIGGRKFPVDMAGGFSFVFGECWMEAGWLLTGQRRNYDEMGGK
jgi:hypothetical protein